jgi:hypothetical protein
MIYILGRVPAVGASKYRGIIIANDINRVEYVVKVRGINDPDDPGSWVDIGSYAALASGNGGICVADVNIGTYITAANYHQLEFALAIRQTSTGSGSSTGTLRTTGGVSY